MAIRNVTDFKGLYCGYEAGNLLSGVGTVAIRNVTDCKGLYCGYEEATDKSQAAQLYE